ncbi:MAG: Wzz/FepE/Etk N-terminal domain-containing protein [Parcubacteria group bacterium]|jgi:capsular polysaccharide biosynthesis protein
MNQENFWKIIKQKLKVIFVVSFVVAACVFTISTIIKPKYRSDISVLVVQKQPEDKVDAFSAAKSAEYLSDIFSKIIFTDSFIDDVLQSPVGVKNVYSTNKEDRKKEWEKEVSVKKVNNTGIIEISVFDPSRKEAEKVAQAIASNLATNNQKYHGGGDKIVISVIDGPVTTQNPATPNIPLNILIGFVMGLIGTVGYLYFFGKEEPEYRALDHYHEIR